ncbi:MAG: FAD-binding protein, partial [Sphingobacteriaceae bacterium]
MTKEIEIVLLPEDAISTYAIKIAAAQSLKIALNRLQDVKIHKRSIDARGRKVVYRLKVIAFIDETPTPEIFAVNYPNVTDKKPVIIVGAGPAGLFAALRCIELGLKPIVLERGKDVKQRRRDLAAINKEGLINPESNYC